MKIAYPLMVGTKVRIKEGIYEGNVVRIAEVLNRVDPKDGDPIFGYAVAGLGAFESTLTSTFWDDEIERV